MPESLPQKPPKSPFLAIECVEPERMGDCQAAIDRLAELLERYLGATVVVKTLVTRDNPRVEL